MLHHRFLYCCLISLTTGLATACGQHFALGVKPGDPPSTSGQQSKTPKLTFQPGELTELTQGLGSPVLLNPKNKECPHVRIIQGSISSEIRQEFPHWYRVVSEPFFSAFQELNKDSHQVWGLHGTRNRSEILQDQKVKNSTCGEYRDGIYCAVLGHFKEALRYGSCPSNGGLFLFNILKEGDNKYGWEITAKAGIPYYLLLTDKQRQNWESGKIPGEDSDTEVTSVTLVWDANTKSLIRKEEKN